MVPMNHFPEGLVDAVRIWAGWGIMPAPNRSEARLKSRYGEGRGAELLLLIKSLEADFYSSTAHLAAKDLKEMATVSFAEFRGRHPEMPPEVAEVFAWCYTFDYR